MIVKFLNQTWHTWLDFYTEHLHLMKFFTSTFSAHPLYTQKVCKHHLAPLPRSKGRDCNVRGRKHSLSLLFHHFILPNERHCMAMKKAFGSYQGGKTNKKTICIFALLSMVQGFGYRSVQHHRKKKWTSGSQLINYESVSQEYTWRRTLNL